MSIEIKSADILQQKRQALHYALKEQVKKLCAEAKKLGYDSCFSTRLEPFGLIEAKNGKYTYLRCGDEYYVSEFDTPRAELLIKGVQVLKKLVEAFNAKVADNMTKMQLIEKEMDNIVIAKVS